MNAPSTRDLLTLLVAQGHLSEADAQQTRRRQQRSGMAPELALMDLGELSQEIIYRGVAQVNNLPFVVLATTRMEPEAIKKVSPKVVLHYKIMPVKVENGILTIAFSSPPDHRERENLRLLLSARIQPVIASPADIHRATKGHYGLGADTVLQIRTDRDMLSRVEDNDYDKDYATDIEEDIQGASITQLVNQILLEALEMTATDVHIEPFQDSVRLRYRIDGVMREIPTPQGLRELHSAIISRLKIMASLNIAEKRLPHDGRIRLTIGGEEFDLRVSIMPTRYGETLNMRILNRASVFYDLEQLGLEKPQYELMLRLLNLSHGMILVTGPTGSGKTTTLYSSLDKTDKDTRKVITVEDPIEYQLFGISQIQIHDKIGLT
ncbi:MAG: type II secretory ATPase GspE/PulE/Tfp pilus assembly ATPase PilB-like protein, partial [Rhodothermales bacterium]